MPLQPHQDIEKWYDKYDPWEYETAFDDKKRKDILLTEIPNRTYNRVLDIGCGHGFVTRDLPGDEIIGIDISEKAVRHAQSDAKKFKKKHITYKVGDLFSLEKTVSGPFDLILITGVLYPQYIGKSNTLVYHKLDQLLAENGILVSVHIDDWYTSRFPFLLLQQYFYNYRDFSHRLEVYIK